MKEIKNNERQNTHIQSAVHMMPLNKYGKTPARNDLCCSAISLVVFLTVYFVLWFAGFTVYFKWSLTTMNFFSVVLVVVFVSVFLSLSLQFHYFYIALGTGFCHSIFTCQFYRYMFSKHCLLVDSISPIPKMAQCFFQESNSMFILMNCVSIWTKMFFE